MASRARRKPARDATFSHADLSWICCPGGIAVKKFAAFVIVAATTSAQATVVYQTVQPDGPLSANYHTNITQVSGNASQNLGDELKLGNSTTDRYLTSIVVPTQTFQAPSTPAYSPAFLELRVWANNGPLSSDGTTPDGNPTPGTLPIAVARATGINYPAGGNHGSVTNFQGIPVTFNFQPVATYNYTGAAGGDAPFVNSLSLPERFTVTIVNLNAQGVQDGSNPNGNAWGPYLSLGSTTNTDPDSNPATDNENSAFNTNVVGNSRTGPVIGFANSGHWLWNQSNGSAPGTNWADSRSQNLVMSMTINAVPEPGAGMLLLTSAVGAFCARRRRGV
jgi:hypothetical protein